MKKDRRGIRAKGLRHPWLLRLFVAWALGPTALLANPTGGSVAAGSAAIGSAGNTVTVTQTSDRAVINWGTFSIASGEITKFVQPSSTSAVLNRVLGGQTSVINGTLTANGQVYLVNGNGIVVGPGGMISAGAFTASTRDISDPDFLAGHLHFSGSNNAGVKNLGTITALGGDVVLIGKTVDNRGTIQAPQGTAGLVAADDVLLAQRNADGSTITVNPSPTATAAASRIGVHNSGTIAAASAELKAANGNIYALAIQNEGTIRATTAQHQGGRIWLTSDQGTVVNTASGVLDASASQAGGSGGQIETSGEQLGIAGTVTAGHGGSWLLDPTDVEIDSVAAATLENALNGGTSETVEAFGGTADLGNIDVNAALSWTGGALLTLTATGDVNVNADITASRGSLQATADSDANGFGDVNIAAGVTVSAVNNAVVLSGNTISVGAGATLIGAGVFFTTDAVNWNGTGQVNAGSIGDFRLTTLTKAIQFSDTPGSAGMFNVDTAFLSHVVGYGELDLVSSHTGEAIVVDGVNLSGKHVDLTTTAGDIHFVNNASTFGSLSSTRISSAAGDIIVDADVTTVETGFGNGIYFNTGSGNARYLINANLTSAADIRLENFGSITVAPGVTLSGVGFMSLSADFDLNGVGDLTLGAGSTLTFSGGSGTMIVGGVHTVIDPTVVLNAGAAGTLSLIYETSVGIGTAQGTNQITDMSNLTFHELDVSSAAPGDAIYVGDLNALDTANHLDWTTATVLLDAVGPNGNVVFENADPLSFGALSAYAYNDIVFNGAGSYVGTGGNLLLNADYDSDAVGSLRVNSGTVSNAGSPFYVVAAAVDGIGALDSNASITYTHNLHLTRPPASPLLGVGLAPVVNQPFNSFSQLSAQTQASSIQTVSPAPSALARPSFNASFFSVPAPGGGAPPVFVAQGNNMPTDDDGGSPLAFGSSYRRGQGQ